MEVYLIVNTPVVEATATGGTSQALSLPKMGIDRPSRSRGWGPVLSGPHKYLGGALQGDWLIGVPSNAEHVVRLNLRSGEVDLGAQVPRGRFKWLRGVRAADGAVFCIPACADAVLRIGTDGEVTQLGQGTLPSGEWKWHGGALSKNGHIYAIPANAQRVLKIEPETGNVYMIGPELQPGVQNKWYGGIVASDGTIWGMPYNASSVLRIDPSTDEVTEIGDFATGGWKWHGGARSGDFIIGVPSHADRVLRVDPARRTAELIGPKFDGEYKWGGAAVDGNGIVWGIPSDATTVLRVDPVTSKVTTLGKLSEWRNKWQGGVLAADGKVYCVPCDAPQVLIIDPIGHELSLLGSLPLQPKKYQGGAAAPDGTIWCLPECCEQILRIDPAPDVAVGMMSNTMAAKPDAVQARLSCSAEDTDSLEHDTDVDPIDAESAAAPADQATRASTRTNSRGRPESAKARKKRRRRQQRNSPGMPLSEASQGLGAPSVSSPPKAKRGKAGEAKAPDSGSLLSRGMKSASVDAASWALKPTTANSRIWVDDAEPVSAAHWAKWERAWEAAGKLEGRRRALITLDEALALADAIDQAWDAVHDLSETGALTVGCAQYGKQRDLGAMECQAAATSLDVHVPARVLAIAEACEDAQVALAPAEAMSAIKQSTPPLVSLPRSPPEPNTKIPTFSGTDAPAVFAAQTGAAAARSVMENEVAPADSVKPAEEADGTTEAVGIVMTPELSSETLPTVFCVRETGLAQDDPSKMEPRAILDCNLGDLMKTCVIL